MLGSFLVFCFVFVWFLWFFWHSWQCRQKNSREPRLRNVDIQTLEQPMLSRLRELNWQTSGKKTHLFERKILLSIL